MIVVDSSVWIDYFNGRESAETDTLDRLVGVEMLGIGDLILAEVLRGFRSDEDYLAARRALASLDVFPMLGAGLALRSADNYRALRKRGGAVRKTADAIVATFCIEAGYPLLFADRGFLPFVEHLGLQAVAVCQ